MKQLKTPKEIRQEIINELPKYETKKPFFNELISIIKLLSDEKPDGFTDLDLKNRMIDHELDDNKVMELLDQLLREGYIYEKKIGYYKITY